MFPVLCITAITPQAQPDKGAWAIRLVYGIAVYEFLLLAIGLSVGFANQLDNGSYLAVTLIATVILAVKSWQSGLGIDVGPFARFVKTRRGLATVTMAVLVAVIYSIELGIDARYGTRHIDGLWYHIPRIIFWRQQGNFDAWLTPVWSQIGLPLGSDIVFGQKILLGGGWSGTGYVSFVLSMGAVACVYIIALDLRFSRWNSAISSILFGSFPAIGLRIWSVNSDIAAAFPVLAAYVVLRRVRNPNLGIAFFIVLNGVALACKQTVIFHAVLLSCVVFWQCRGKISKIRSIPLVAAACVLSASLIVFSFLPIYQKFGDLDGGAGGRGHKVTSFAEFNHSVAMSACHWILEPLGYASPIPRLDGMIRSISKSVYNSIGANFEVLPDEWKPWPAQDISRSGLVSILFLPMLFMGLSRKARIPSIIIFLLGFVPLSGILHSSPYFARYTIVLLAGYALIWGGTRYFKHGNKRWVLIYIVGINIFSLLGVVLMRIYVDHTVKSKPGGPFYLISDDDRARIAKSLNGRPLQIITSDSLDALLVGQNISYPMKYIVEPDNGDWQHELMEAGGISNWLAVVHDGKGAIPLAENCNRPNMIFPKEVSMKKLESALQYSGWQLYRHGSIIDLWCRDAPVL
jgi:hypothetical protein